MQFQQLTVACFVCSGSVLQRLGVCCRLSPDRLQHHSDLRQVASLFLEPGQRHAGQEARPVWGRTPDGFPHQHHKVRYRGTNSISPWCDVIPYIATDRQSAVAKMKMQHVCVLVCLAETGEAQVCAVRDLCRKRRRHHRRLKWEHPGVGKRHVNSSIQLLFVQRRPFTLFCMGATCTRDNKSKNPTFRQTLKLKKRHYLSFSLRLIYWSSCPSVNLPSSSGRPLCRTLSSWTFPSVSSHLCHAGTNRISHGIQGAHEGSIFALSMLRNGTLVSGGKDRRLVSWDSSYQQIQTVEVRKHSAEITRMQIFKDSFNKWRL